MYITHKIYNSKYTYICYKSAVTGVTSVTDFRKVAIVLPHH